MSYDQRFQLRGKGLLGGIDDKIQDLSAKLIKYSESRFGVDRNYVSKGFHLASSALLASYAFLTNDPDTSTQIFVAGLSLYEVAKIFGFEPLILKSNPTKYRKAANMLAALYSAGAMALAGGVGTIVYGLANQDAGALDVGTKLTIFSAGLDAAVQGTYLDRVRVWEKK